MTVGPTLVRMEAHAMILSTSSAAAVHQELWALFVKSILTIACLVPATTTVPVWIKWADLNVGAHQALLVHVVRVTSMSVCPAHVQRLALKIVCNLSTIMHATVSQATWDAIVKQRLTSVEVLHAKMVECVDNIKLVTLVSVRMVIQA